MSYELDIRCHNCGRFLQIKASKSSEIEVKCTDRKCKQWNKIKVVMLSDYGNESHEKSHPNHN